MADGLRVDEPLEKLEPNATPCVVPDRLRPTELRPTLPCALCDPVDDLDDRTPLLPRLDDCDRLIADRLAPLERRDDLETADRLGLPPDERDEREIDGELPRLR